MTALEHLNLYSEDERNRMSVNFDAAHNANLEQLMFDYSIIQ
jgi:hypothetical protein